jgi:RHS repeat-associated protein
MPGSPFSRLSTTFWGLILGVTLFLFGLGHLNFFNTQAVAAPGLSQFRTSLLPLNLSRPPSNGELMAAGQLGGPLYPTHELADPGRLSGINISFGQAIQTWNNHDYINAVELFRRHVASYPDSPWAGEALLHIGCDAQYNGRYTEAEYCFNYILEAFRGSSHAGAQMLAHKARVRLANQKTLQGNFKEAMAQFALLYQSSPDWRDRTYATHWIQRLSRQKGQEQALLNCGAQALASVLRGEGKEATAEELMGSLAPSKLGHSLNDLQALAVRYGYRCEGRQLAVSDLKKIPLPAIMQLQPRNQGDSGHYWVLEKYEQDTLALYDPQSDRRFQQTAAEFSREWAGHALVLANRENLPGQRLAAAEMQQLYGGCCGIPRAESDLGDPGTDDPGCGAPAWSVNKINLNFFATDTPLWYRPPIGPAVAITLSYNSQSGTAQYEICGNKWRLNYASYLTLDSGGRVTIFMPDGRRDIYTPKTDGSYKRPYQIFNTLTKLSADNFELKFPDGTVYVYKTPGESKQLFLVQIRDAYGQKLTFTYNAQVHLTRITDALGRQTVLTYNARGLIAKATDPFGRSATFAYDANKNLTKITDMGGYWTSFTYDANVFLTSLTNAKGTWKFYTEPSDGKDIENASNPYPAPGAAMWENYRITATNPLGRKQEYYYDGYHFVGWFVSPRSYKAYVDTENSNLNAPKTQYQYAKTTATTTGTRGEVSEIKLPEGGGFWSNVNTAGYRTSINDYWSSMEFTYNAMGRTTSSTLPNYTKMTFTYAANLVDLLAVKNGLGTVALTYNTMHDVTSVTDRLGNKTAFAYNSYGQPKAITDALGGVTAFVYDAAHHLQQITRPGQVLRSFTYDSLDRVDTHTDATGLMVNFDYDNLDRITRVTYPDGKFVSIAYSTCCPRLVDSVTERSGRTYSYSYDKLNRLIQETNPEGGVTKYVYDPDGNLVQLIDPKGNITKFTYDLNNRLLKQVYGDGSYVAYTYNEAGMVTEKRNARGVKLIYNYDLSKNITGVNAEDWSLLSMVYQYDDFNRLILAKNWNSSLSYEFKYNANSQLIRSCGPWKTNYISSDVVTYKYDALGRRISMTPQKGDAVTYSYDSLNRLTGVTIGTLHNYVYKYIGASPLVQSLTRPNGSVTKYTYDALKRLTKVANLEPDATVIDQYVYTFNARDQRSTETVTGAAHAPYTDKAATFTYNKLNQLLTSTGPSRSYTYDKDGNLTGGYTPQGYPFTATYDPANRLQTLSYTSGGVTYKTEYDYISGLLIEVRKYQNNVLKSTNRYVYDGYRPIQERNAGNLVLNQYVWGLHRGGGIGGLLNLNKGGANYSYLYDGKGNVTALLNANIEVAASYKYDPFGRLQAGAGVYQPFLFSTKPYDPQTGLSYYGFRYYSPDMGRWLTRDPLGEGGGLNLYAFVSNNPVNKIDPVGLWEWPWEDAASKTAENLAKDEGKAKVLETLAKSQYPVRKDILEEVDSENKPSEEYGEVTKRIACEEGAEGVKEYKNPLRRLWEAVTNALGGQETTGGSIEQPQSNRPNATSDMTPLNPRQPRKPPPFRLNTPKERF